MKSRKILLAGAIICGLAVIIGAFGAHALKDILEANDRVSPFETGVLYQMFHGLAILILGVLSIALDRKVGDSSSNINQWLNRAFWCFLIGVLLFSGSLYGLALLPQLKWLGPVTPIGGVLFIGGWIALILSVSKK